MNELQADLIRLARVSALDEMGSALAHEINQPLTAIILYLQAAQRELERCRQTMSATDHAALEAHGKAVTIINKAGREAQRTGSIIQRIRNLVEKRAPQRRIVDFNDIIDEAIDLTLLGQNCFVTVIRNYADDLPALYIDPVQIQQVVVNLVRNAIEAVSEKDKGIITITTLIDDSSVVLSVEDNGPGIAQEHMKALFQAFNTGKKTGMGLGLVISRTITQNHGGEFIVDGGGDGRGAGFIVRLPVTPPDSPVVEVF
jgi:two-component system sensor kinase FixL